MSLHVKLHVLSQVARQVSWQVPEQVDGHESSQVPRPQLRSHETGQVLSHVSMQDAWLESSANLSFGDFGDPSGWLSWMSRSKSSVAGETAESCCPIWAAAQFNSKLTGLLFSSFAKGLAVTETLSSTT